MEEDSTKKSDSKPDLASLQIPNAQWKRAALMAKTASAIRDTISVDSDTEVDAKQQIKYGTRCQAAWALILEYCDYSNIHGIRYLGEKKRPLLERLFWITAVIFSICVCAKLIMNIWDKWNYNPVIVSFAEKSTPVWQIPFPSVTVCPETKSKQTVFNYTDVYWQLSDKKNISESEQFRMHVLAQVCEPHLMNGIDFGTKTSASKDLIQALSETMPTLNDTYVECKWRNNATSCESLFTRILSEEGLCYSFNALSPREVFRGDALISDFKFKTDDRLSTDWNVEDWYNPDALPTTYPNRVLGPGQRAGLYLVLKGIEKDFDNLCRGPVQGFKILLTTPGEVAQVSKQYFRIPFDQEVLISIKPKIITTSEGLKDYEPHRRQCYFQKERDLHYFLIYSQANCELECLANFTLTKCKCVKFSMPRGENVPVCGAASIACMNEAEDELLLKEFNQGMKTSRENYRGETECDCLPSCTSIAYEAEISQADFDYKTMWDGRDNPQEHLGSKMSRLSIFFKEAQFLTSKRSELYGRTDFLANCGGLLGLFMGVSLLSLVEIIYFCTVRLVSNLKMRSSKRKEMENGGDETKEA